MGVKDSLNFVRKELPPSVAWTNSQWLEIIGYQVLDGLRFLPVVIRISPMNTEVKNS